MKKKIIILTLGLFSAVSVRAQDDITKQMEVTRAYTPKVGRASKLPVEPRMVDTVQLRPEIAYEITPSAWQTVFETDKYNPARISVTPYSKNHPFYLRVGAGYPLQSTADLYFNPYIGNRSTFGMYVNHRGSYSNIENDMAMKPNSTEMLNAIGLYGSKHFRRYKLEGRFDYDNRLYHAYAEFPEIEGVLPLRNPQSLTESTSGSSIVPGSPEIVYDRINYGRASGSIWFGDTFADMSRFNFQVGLNAGFAHERSGYNQLDIDAWAMIGRMYGGKHGFEIGLYERGAVGVGKLADYSSVAVSLNPNYILALEKLLLRAGVDLTCIDSSPDTKSRFLLSPEIEATLNIAGGYFTPYLTLTSQLLDNGFEALSRRNPYIVAGETAATGWIYDARIGFRGSVNGVFSYGLWGGASWLNNYAVLYARNRLAEAMGLSGTVARWIDDTVRFATFTDDGMMYTIGAELQISPGGGFSAKLSGNWYSCDFNTFPIADGMPGYDAGLELKYVYKDKFSISAGAELTGKRQSVYYLHDPENPATSLSNLTGNIITDTPAVVDVSLSAEYNISKSFGVFAEGRNLANQKLYPYNHYRGLGANVMLGIKAVF